MEYNIRLSEAELAFLREMIDLWFGTVAIEDDADPQAREVFLGLCEQIRGAAAVAELEGPAA